MKAIASIPLIGLIGTITIIVSVLVPPAIVRTAIDKELLLTHGYERGQHALLTLFYSSQGDKSAYEILSQKSFFEDFVCSADLDCPEGYTCNLAIQKCDGPTTKPLKDRLDNVLGKDKYCITTEKPQPKLPVGQPIAPPSILPSNEVLKRVCASNTIGFNTLIVLPYNKDSLVKLIRIGLG